MAIQVPTTRLAPEVRQYSLIGIAVLVGAVILFALWYFSIRVPYAPVFTDLKSSEAATIIGELDRQKMSYRLADDGTSILVPADKVDSTRINILSGDLPLKGAVGFELFNKTDMGLSEFAQKINYQRALQGELARTIMALNEIDTARVHLSLPESGIFERDRQLAKASITVSTKSRGGIDATVVRGIQHLVASAVPGLQALNVAILDAQGRLLSDEVAPVAQLSSFDRRRLADEAIYATRVRDALHSAGLSMPIVVDVQSFDSYADAGRQGEFSEGTAVSGTPQSERRGALRVSLILAAEPGAPLRERLLTAAGRAFAFDAARGDVLAIRIDPSRVLPPVARGWQPTTVPSKPQASQRMTPLPFSWLWLFAAASGLAILVLVVRRILHGAPTMAPSDREAFAAKLRLLLDEEAENVPTSA